MSTILLNPLSLFLGFLAGIAALVALIGHLDRSVDSRYFYRILLLLIGLVGAVIVIGTTSG